MKKRTGADITREQEIRGQHSFSHPARGWRLRDGDTPMSARALFNRRPTQFVSAELPLTLVLGVLAFLSGCDTLPTRDSSAESLRLSADCMAAGMRSFDHLKADLKERWPETTFEEPKFHFNKRLNACLMQVEFWSVLGGARRVVNVYENKILLSAGDIKNGKDGKPEVFGERDGQPNQDMYVRFDESAKKVMTE
jgi:hypothetical protein